MAEAKGIFTTADVWDDGKKIHAVGRLAVTAGPDTYTTGGIAFDVLANSIDGAGLGLPLPVVNSQPLWANIVGGAYFGQYNPTTKKMKLSVIVGGAEVASGAVPGALSSDVINAYFIFDKF
jgi:hypothetical protein